MAVNERDRHRFYETARAKLGEAEADYLMEVLPPVGWGDVATKHDLGLLKHDLHELETRLESKFGALETTFDAKLTRLEARLMRANIVSMIGVAGLVLAAGAVG
jgi:hypothetical protein